MLMMFVDSKYLIHKGLNATGHLEKMTQCVSWQTRLIKCQWSNRYFRLLFVTLAVLRLFSCIRMSSGEGKMGDLYCDGNTLSVSREPKVSGNNNRPFYGICSVL